MKTYWKIALGGAVLCFGFLAVWLFGGEKTEKIHLEASSSVESEKMNNFEQAIPSEDDSFESDSGNDKNPEANRVEEKIAYESEKKSPSEDSGEDEKLEEKKEKEEKPSPGSLGTKESLVGWGHEKSSGRKIDTIIIHSTYNALGGDQFDLNKIIAIYKSYGVAPHYIIDRNGIIYQLVKDADVAYHAGESKMPDGRTGVNAFSLGIEIITSKAEKPTSSQYNSLKILVANLKEKYSIKHILGHSDIAPGRKDDPWNFDWKKL